MRNRLLAVLVALLAASSLASTAGARREQGSLTIYAAASLTEVFSSYDRAQRYSFAGSNALETQIRNGAPADVFGSAAPLNTQRLFKEGLVLPPVTFTANRLALIVPRSNPAGIRSVYDLRSKDVKLVIAGASAYSRVIDWKRFKSIADSVDALLMVDMAHYAGLVAAGVYPSPVGIGHHFRQVGETQLRRDARG